MGKVARKVACKIFQFLSLIKKIPARNLQKSIVTANKLVQYYTNVARL